MVSYPREALVDVVLHLSRSDCFRIFDPQGARQCLSLPSALLVMCTLRKNQLQTSPRDAKAATFERGDSGFAAVLAWVDVDGTWTVLLPGSLVCAEYWNE